MKQTHILIWFFALFILLASASFALSPTHSASAIMNGTINNTLTIQNGNVGIGTTDPKYKLDIAGRSRFKSGQGGFTSGFWLTDMAGTDKAFFGMNTDDQTVGIWGNGMFRFLMNVNDGNVGIGKIPVNKLSVAGNVDANDFYVAASGKWLSQALNSQWSSNGASIYYNNGNVGIGTTSPQQRLNVVGGIEASGPSASLFFDDITGNSHRWQWVSFTSGVYSYAALYNNYGGQLLAITHTGRIFTRVGEICYYSCWNSRCDATECYQTCNFYTLDGTYKGTTGETRAGWGPWLGTC